MRRPEEILEIAELVDEAAESLVTVLERSGADALYSHEVLHEIARRELELAAVDIAALTYGPQSRLRLR
jgi:hypothetical protein